MVRIGVSFGVLLGCALEAVACGGKALLTSDDGDIGGASMGETGGRVSGSAGTGGRVGGIGGKGSGVASGGRQSGTECSIPRNDAGWSLLVRINNKTNQPIYVGQDAFTCGIELPFQLRDANGKLLPSPGACTQSCEALASMGATGCPGICYLPSTTRLEPGAATQIRYDGLYLEQLELPVECLVDPKGGRLCARARHLDVGSIITFTARAGTIPDCSQTPGGACAACTPNPDGGCNIGASISAGTIYSANLTLKLDAAYGLGATGPNGAPLPIELYVTE